MANTNRTKGHDAERYYAQEFRDIGYDKCKTSRYGSRMHDDCAIDLIFIPFNVQIKAGKQRAMNPSKVLRDIDERTLEVFPDGSPELENINMVIHKKEVGRGNKRDKYDEIVVMAWEDVKVLLSKLLDK